MNWKTSIRNIDLSEPIVMGILNVTPDSFSDGGKFFDAGAAIDQAAKMIEDGAAIIDIGGESTRPGSQRVAAETELERIVPIIEAVRARFDVPVSVDTSKVTVARGAMDAGAEIINDISGLRFDEGLAQVAVETGAGLILMHSRGQFETMHSQPPVADIMTEVTSGLRHSAEKAIAYGVPKEAIVLDIGIGFGKTPAQNLELIAKLDKIADTFKGFPLLVGASRKSFLGKILNEASPEARLNGSIAAAVISVWNGARIVRVHDVRETVEAIKVLIAMRSAGGQRSIGRA